MEKELLPCPFCGGEAKIFIKPVFQEKIYVQCTKCNASSDFISASMNYCAKDRAVEAWNSRVPAADKAAECDYRCVAPVKLTHEQIDTLIKAVTGGKETP